ncbi:MAG: DUF4275 family protein [Ruminococcaceae bacterium]|nr:DUF4275 family protein [Oscillospiraceae bacterium]
MFVKKATAAQIEAAVASLRESFGELTYIDNVPVKQYMLKWMSAFAPDVTVYDAKSFCLPKKLFRNYLWHAFSFQKTDSYVDEDAVAQFQNGFEGKCYILLNDENIICAVPDGRIFDPENVKHFKNIIIFTADYTKTYVHTGNPEFGPFYKSSDMTESEDAEPDESFIVNEEEENEE